MRLVIFLLVCVFCVIGFKHIYQENIKNNDTKDVSASAVKNPVETETAYYVTPEDWDYLCKDGEKNFNRLSVTVPSGLNISYRYEREPTLVYKGKTYYSTSKVPLKPINVIK